MEEAAAVVVGVAHNQLQSEVIQASAATALAAMFSTCTLSEPPQLRPAVNHFINYAIPKHFSAQSVVLATIRLLGVASVRSPVVASECLGKMQLLRQVLLEWVDDADVMELHLGLLWQLSSRPQSECLMEQLMEPVVKAMAAHPAVPGVQQSGCWILGNTAETVENEKAVLAIPNTIATLAAALLGHAADVDVQRAALHAIVNLTTARTGWFCDPNRRKLHEHEAQTVTGTLAVLKRFPELASTTCQALGNLLLEARFHKWFIDADAHINLAQTLASARDTDTQEYACRALWNLTGSVEGTQAVLCSVALDAVLGMLRVPGSSQVVAAACLSVLANVTRTPEGCAKAAEIGAAELVVVATRSNTQLETQQVGCAVMGQLSLCEPARQQLLQVDAPTVLCAALQRHPDFELTWHVLLAAVRFLSAGECPAVHVIGGAVVDAMRRFYDCQDLQLVGIDILHRLAAASSAVGRQLVEQHKAHCAIVVVMGAHRNETAVQIAACTALEQFAKDNSLQLAADDVHCAVLQAGARSRDSLNVQRAVVKAMHALCEEHSDCVDRMVKAPHAASSSSTDDATSSPLIITVLLNALHTCKSEAELVLMVLDMLFTVGPHMRQIWSTAKASQQLVQLLQKSSNMYEHQKRAIAVACVMATEQAQAEELAQEGIVPVVTTAMQVHSYDKEFVQNCLECLFETLANCEDSVPVPAGIQGVVCGAMAEALHNATVQQSGCSVLTLVGVVGVSETAADVALGALSSHMKNVAVVTAALSLLTICCEAAQKVAVAMLARGVAPTLQSLLRGLDCCTCASMAEDSASTCIGVMTMKLLAILQVCMLSKAWRVIDSPCVPRMPTQRFH